MPKNKLRDSILFFLLITLSASASFYSLTGKPPVWFDEGIFLHTGRVLADEGRFGVQLTPGQFTDASVVTVGYPLLAPLSVVIKIFGASILSARLLMIFFIFGFVLCFFLLAKKMYSTSIALASTFLLVSFAPLYGVGKSVIGEVPGLFYLTSGLLFLHSIETEAAALRPGKRYIYALLAGFGFGLAASTKPVFLVITGAVAIALALRFRFWRRHLRELLIGAAGFMLTLITWMGTQFGGSFNPLRLLTFYANPYLVGSDTVVNFIQTNLLRFFTESTPAHFFLLSLAFLAFLSVKARAKEKIYSGEIIAAAFVVLIFLAYLRTPGWYRYFFPAHALLFLFLPAALARIAELTSLRRWRLQPFIIVALLFAVQLGHFVREEHGYQPDETASARAYLATIPVQRSVLFYNAAELAYLYPHKNFYQYLGINESLKVGESSLAGLKRGEFDVLAIPNAYVNDSVINPCYKLEHTAGKYSFFSKDSNLCPEMLSL